MPPELCFRDQRMISRQSCGMGEGEGIQGRGTNMSTGMDFVGGRDFAQEMKYI